MAFFLSELPQLSRMMNVAGEGNCLRIIHYLPVDRYRSAQRPLCPCLDGKEEMGGEALAIARPGRLPTMFVGARFLPAIGSPVRVVRPPVWPALLFLLPTLGARGGIGLRGPSSLDC